MKKTLILLDNNKDINNIILYISDKYKNDNIIVSCNFDDIENDEVGNIIYVGSCNRYNNSLDDDSIVLVNEAFTRIENKDERVLSSFSINYYLNEAAQQLNKGISIINVLSSNTKDKTLASEMYDKYVTLGLDKNSYNILNKANIIKKKASSILKVSDNISTDYSDIIDIVMKSLL